MCLRGEKGRNKHSTENPWASQKRARRVPVGVTVPSGAGDSAGDTLGLHASVPAEGVRARGAGLDGRERGRSGRCSGPVSGRTHSGSRGPFSRSQKTIFTSEPPMSSATGLHGTSPLSTGDRSSVGRSSIGRSIVWGEWWRVGWLVWVCLCVAGKGTRVAQVLETMSLFVQVSHSPCFAGNGGEKNHSETKVMCFVSDTVKTHHLEHFTSNSFFPFLLFGFRFFCCCCWCCLTARFSFFFFPLSLPPSSLYNISFFFFFIVHLSSWNLPHADLHTVSIVQ